MALVLDASGLLASVLVPSATARDLRLRFASDVCHAPHLIDAEIGHALRRQVLRGDLLEATGADLLGEVAALVDERHEMSGGLASAAWGLRDRLSFYEALYVALAAAIRCPLVTADRRLASTALCDVILVG